MEIEIILKDISYLEGKGNHFREGLSFLIETTSLNRLSNLKNDIEAGTSNFQL